METVDVPDKGFATRVLERIGKPGWDKFDERKNITSAEDYALALLSCGDRRIESENFHRLLDRRYGKPAQGMFMADTREATPDLTYGDLPTPTDKPRAAGKPN